MEPVSVTGNEFCVVIPVYNNAGTIKSVVGDVLDVCDRIIVVNDGSTDDTGKILREIKGIELIEYPENRGKGHALRQGFKVAMEKGFRYAVTIDGDGQHAAADILKLTAEAGKYPDTLIIGSRNIEAEGMPGKNTFANKFSNFWYKVETGKRLPDTQSGFRLYPLHKMKGMRFFTKGYEFEVEALVRLTWKRVPVRAVPVSVYYPPEGERVSHFRPLPDFMRISLLNTVLVLWALLYIYPRNLVYYLRYNNLYKVIKEQLVLHNESPVKVSSALGLGVFMGIVPIWGFQMIVAASLAHLLRLNKILVLVASNISIPPVIPFILYFSYKTGGLLMGTGETLTSENIVMLKNQIMTGSFYQTINELGYSIVQYIVGSLALAVIAGTFVMMFSFFTLSVYKPQTGNR